MAKIAFSPDYSMLAEAAYNRPARRLPLYEHQINTGLIEQVLGKELAPFQQGKDADLRYYYTQYCRFFLSMGYDAVPFECCIGGSMPGAGALGDHRPGVIHNRADFERYPWDELPALYFAKNAPHFEMLRECLPPGMKAVGGVGNGVFECVQEIVGYINLCYISADDPALYHDLFTKMGEVHLRIWAKFMAEYSDSFAVCRFGDDLGFRSSTLLSSEDIRRHMLPCYRKVVDLVHLFGKPFLLHSCGNLLEIMDELITVTGINAKHSNEDAIAPFTLWVERFGNRIGNFGGIDTDAVCRLSRPEMREYIFDLLNFCRNKGGIAFSSGNSIPDYVPAEGYLNMIQIAREWRGE